MFVCEYCGRYLKKKYEKCPACGANKFKRIQNVGEIVIKEPPKGGYKVNLKNFRHERKGHWPGLVLGLWVIGAGASICIPFISVGILKDESGFQYFNLIFLIAGIFCLIAVLRMAFMFLGKSKEIIQSSNKNINKVKYLAKNGILIKNLKYKIIPIKSQDQGNKTIYKIQVIYELEKGKTKCYESEPKYLTALGRDDGTVDLLVDPNDHTNYFIDFEIY